MKAPTRLLLALLLASLPAGAADNYAVTQGAGTTLAAKDNAGVLIPQNTQVTNTGTAIYGTAGASSSAVVSVQGIASGTVLPVSGTVTTTPPANASTNIAQVAGATVATGHGVAASALRVELPTDGTGVVGLNGGSNVIGSLTANQSVNAAQVNGNATDTNSGNKSAGTLRVVIATDQPTNTNALNVQQSTTPWLVTNTPAVSGGLTIGRVISAASTNATSTKGSAGQVCGLQASNTNAAARYLKLYNKASAPTVGSDTPVMTLLIPPNSSGIVMNNDLCIAFATGIAFALTTGVTDADTGAVAANEIVTHLFYK